MRLQLKTRYILIFHEGEFSYFENVLNFFELHTKIYLVFSFMLLSSAFPAQLQTLPARTFEFIQLTELGLLAILLAPNLSILTDTRLQTSGGS